MGAVPTSAIYIELWADFYESVALASYFLLLLAYVCPVAEQRDEFFDTLPHQGGPSSLAMYRVIIPKWRTLVLTGIDSAFCQQRTWLFVFQYIPVSFICAVATDITQGAGVYCENSDQAYFAHIWVSAVPFNIALSRILLTTIVNRHSDNSHPLHLRGSRLHPTLRVLQTSPQAPERASYWLQIDSNQGHCFHHMDTERKSHLFTT